MVFATVVVQARHLHSLSRNSNANENHSILFFSLRFGLTYQHASLKFKNDTCPVPFVSLETTTVLIRTKTTVLKEKRTCVLRYATCIQLSGFAIRLGPTESWALPCAPNEVQQFCNFEEDMCTDTLHESYELTHTDYIIRMSHENDVVSLLWKDKMKKIVKLLSVSTISLGARNNVLESTSCWLVL